MRRSLLGIAVVAMSVAPALSVAAETIYTDQSVDQPARPQGQSAQGKSSDKARPGDLPALLTADQLIHDRDLDTITASGHVEVDQGGSTLLADAVSYNLKQDVIIATGNVSVTDVDGEVRFADYVELSGDFKQATARNLRLLMADNSRFAAAIGRRTNGNRNILDNAIYSPCQPCADDPDGPPLWDLRARRITHDEVAHRVIYDDAWFDVAGVPVLYTPYFSHSDPTIKRESGLLVPSFFSNNIIGNGIRGSYYQIISPYQDATIEPMYTSKEGPGFMGDWRARFADGEMTTSMSVANEPSVATAAQTTTGWNISAKSQFALDDTWRAGYDIDRASDRDYMRYYDFPTPQPYQPYLTARPYVEGFSSRDYASIETYSFQNQTDITIPPPPGIPDKTATVLPLITYSAQSEPGWEGTYWTFDTHGASIMRGDDETNSRRVNTLSAWHLPYTSDDGEVYQLITSVRADAYNSDHVLGLGPGTVNAYRLIPQASVDWRYPLGKIGDHWSQTFTPILMANIGPYGGNSANIPNEDSLDFELDDSNIFNPQPFTGFDRVASGPRLAYGSEYTITNLNKGTADFLLAQSYQPRPQDVFPAGTGLDTILSDVVGRAAYSPSPDFSMSYHFRLAENDFSVRNSEVNVTAGPRPLNVNVSYVLIGPTTPTSIYGMREQVVGTMRAQISRRWGLEIYDTQDLGPEGGPLQTGGRVSYEDECTIIQLDTGERHTTVNTIVSGYYVELTIVLKTLTQFPISLF